MRVKKLNAPPRRPKAGDDDSDTNSSTTLGSPTTTERTWVSPTKDFVRASPSRFPHSSHRELGADSPTDPSGVHPIELHDVDQVHLHHSFGSNSRALFAESDRGIVKNHQMSAGASRDANGRKAVAASSKKANGAAATSWREAVAHSVRDAIHVRIVEYLKALKPNAPEKVLARLPGLASRMEKSLLKLANSQDEYSDLSTLAQRLSSIQQSSAKKLLQQQVAPPRGGPATSSSSSNTPPHENGGNVRGTTPLSEDQARFVFQCLQSWRQKLVNMYGVAPWEILPNPILAKVAVYAPSTEQELGVCGVQEDQIARFGSSLLKELQLICGSTARNVSPSSSANRHAATSAPAKASRKAESTKRAADPKKRKINNLAPAGGEATNGNSRLAPAPNSFMMPHAVNPGAMIPPSQLLFRPPGMDTLPTLLPSAAAGATTSSAKKSAFNSSSSSTATRLSSGPTPLLQQPFFSRLPSPAQQHDGQENNHMHLLAQGAGHMSKQQQDAKTIDMYEKELQTLRWMLHQSQQEKSQLEGEVQRLRHQLQGGGSARDARQSVESQ